MMNKIGVLFKTSLFGVLFILSFCIKNLSSTCVAQTTHSIDTFESFFYIEYCPIQQFSFCWDGGDQPFRPLPLIVYLNKDDLEKSYNEIVFLISLDTKIDTTILSESAQLPEGFAVRDYLINSSIQNGDTLSIYLGNRFKRKINRYYRRSGIKIKFNGRFYYAGLKMKFIAEKDKKCKKYITIPDVKSRTKGRNIKEIPVKEFYVIKKILSIG